MGTDFPQDQVATAAAGPPAPAALRILVVDDHVPTARTLARLLSSRGHAATVATTLAEARARCAAGPAFDLLITDLHLPDGDGRALLAEPNACQGARAIVVSGTAAPGDIDACLRMGFKAFLVKPITMEALLAAIDRAMAAG